MLRIVKPHHFLPVHGEFAFLCEHAQLARESAGRPEHDRDAQRADAGPGAAGKGASFAGSGLVGRGWRAAAAAGSGEVMFFGPPGPNGEPRFDAGFIGEAQLTMFYNDGGRGTGTAAEMALDERRGSRPTASSSRRSTC